MDRRDFFKGIAGALVGAKVIPALPAIEVEEPFPIGPVDAPACVDCGSITLRNGRNYKCVDCGAAAIVGGGRVLRWIR